MTISLYATKSLADTIDRCKDDAGFDAGVFTALAGDAKLLCEAVAGMSNDLQVHNRLYVVQEKGSVMPP